MIRLTSKYTEGAFYVNPDHIISIGCNNAGDTTVELTTDIEDVVRHVTESPEEVVRKVLEWKYIMQKGAYTNTQEMARLRELAGLEDDGHD